MRILNERKNRSWRQCILVPGWNGKMGKDAAIAAACKRGAHSEAQEDCCCRRLLSKRLTCFVLSSRGSSDFQLSSARVSFAGGMSNGHPQTTQYTNEKPMATIERAMLRVWKMSVSCKMEGHSIHLWPVISDQRRAGAELQGCEWPEAADTAEQDVPNAQSINADCIGLCASGGSVAAVVREESLHQSSC